MQKISRTIRNLITWCYWVSWIITIHFDGIVTFIITVMLLSSYSKSNFICIWAFRIISKVTPFWVFGSFSSFHKIPYLNGTKNLESTASKNDSGHTAFLSVMNAYCVTKSAKVFGNFIWMGKASQFQRYPTNINVAGSRFIKANPKPQCL